MRIPGTRQTIDQADIDAVTVALQSDFLTTGPGVTEFENAFATATDSRFAVAVNSGTAALHAAMFATGVGELSGGLETDEVIVPAISFVATANAVLYQNAKPVFADVESDTLRIDVDDVQRKITSRTKAIIAMDYAGQPCDYAALRELADRHRLLLIADACHSLGAQVGARKVGSLADVTCFSLHPAKQITTCEGGVATTDDKEVASRIRAFRNHGIPTDHRARERKITHQYSMESLGYNCRLSDVQCALGLSQLGRLAEFTAKRNRLASLYDSLLADCGFAAPLRTEDSVDHARHLYVVAWNQDAAGCDRDQAFDSLRRQGIGVNVHYRPIYDHPYYQRLIARGQIQSPQCHVADDVYGRVLSLPIFPTMTEKEVCLVVDTLKSVATIQSTTKVAA